MIDWRRENILEGDLLYLPANVKLIQKNEDGTVSRYTLTDKPMGVILINKYQQVPAGHLSRSYWTNLCEVLYNSEKWLVHRKDLYRPNGEKNVD